MSAARRVGKLASIVCKPNIYASAQSVLAEGAQTIPTPNFKNLFVFIRNSTRSTTFLLDILLGEASISSYDRFFSSLV